MGPDRPNRPDSEQKNPLNDFFLSPPCFWHKYQVPQDLSRVQSETLRGPLSIDHHPTQIHSPSPFRRATEVFREAVNATREEFEIELMAQSDLFKTLFSEDSDTGSGSSPANKPPDFKDEYFVHDNANSLDLVGEKAEPNIYTGESSQTSGFPSSCPLISSPIASGHLLLQHASESHTSLNSITSAPSPHEYIFSPANSAAHEEIWTPSPQTPSSDPLSEIVFPSVKMEKISSPFESEFSAYFTIPDDKTEASCRSSPEPEDLCLVGDGKIDQPSFFESIIKEETPFGVEPEVPSPPKVPKHRKSVEGKFMVLNFGTPNVEDVIEQHNDHRDPIVKVESEITDEMPLSALPDAPKRTNKVRERRVRRGKRRKIPHKCDVCDKSFLRLSSYKIHHNIHTGKQIFPCSVCDRVFNVKSNLTRHKKLHAKPQDSQSLQSSSKSTVQVAQ